MNTTMEKAPVMAPGKKDGKVRSEAEAAQVDAKKTS
jgi:hypothetical protein